MSAVTRTPTGIPVGPLVSETAGNVPDSVGMLTHEVAVNIPDKKIFIKDASDNVIDLLSGDAGEIGTWVANNAYRIVYREITTNGQTVYVMFAAKTASSDVTVDPDSAAGPAEWDCSLSFGLPHLFLDVIAAHGYYNENSIVIYNNVTYKGQVAGDHSQTPSVITDGNWAIIASDGADGANGNTLLNGVVPPTTEGVDGDFYLDTNLNLIHGPKAGTWPAGVSLVGSDGADFVPTDTDHATAFTLTDADLGVAHVQTADAAVATLGAVPASNKGQRLEIWNQSSIQQTIATTGGATIVGNANISVNDAVVVKAHGLDTWWVVGGSA